MGAFEPRLLTRNPWVPRRPITVSEYHLMVGAGILHEDDRVELLEGAIVAMTPIGSGHAGTSNSLNRTLTMAVDNRGIVAVRNPIVLDHLNEPQPDFTVLRPRPDFYRGVTPRASDVLLVIEIADSSVRYDRNVKLPLYALHEIPEFWIVDLPAGEIEVCREPQGDTYKNSSRVARDGTLTIMTLPNITIPASAILG